MFAVVSADTVGKLVVVILERQRLGHLLVCQRPVAVLVIQVSTAVLQKDADRLAICFANDRRIVVSTANVHETADVAQHFAKRIGALPSDGPSADAAGTDPADSALAGILGEAVAFSDFGKDFFKQKSGVLVGQRVVFKAAIGRTRTPASFFRKCFGGVSRVDKDSDRDWHFTTVDQIVHHDGGPKLSRRVDVGVSILKDHQGSRLGRIVLGREIHRIVTNGACKNLAFADVLADFTLRHVRLNE